MFGFVFFNYLIFHVVSTLFIIFKFIFFQYLLNELIALITIFSSALEVLNDLISSLNFHFANLINLIFYFYLWLMVGLWLFFLFDLIVLYFDGRTLLFLCSIISSFTLDDIFVLLKHKIMIYFL